MEITRNGKPLDPQAFVTEAIASRQEVIEAMGSDRGYSGHRVAIDQVCPRCEAEGRKNNGGQTPRLSVRIPDGTSLYGIVCATHGDIEG